MNKIGLNRSIRSLTLWAPLLFSIGTCSPGNVASASIIQYGPDTCAQGYVWREAIPSDHVCVTPQVRQQTADDNAQAASRRVPNGVYGSNTCVPGYVWREAFQGDAVCVTPQIRQQTRDDNAQADARRVH